MDKNLKKFLNEVDAYIVVDGKKVPLEEFLDDKVKDANSKELIRESEMTDPLRTTKSKEISITYKGLNNRGDMLFETHTPSSGKTWHQTVRFDKFDEYVDAFKDDEEISDKDLIEAITSDDLKVFCNDPSFKKMNWQWMASQKHYGIVPGSKEPDSYNKENKGSVCKHLLIALKMIPFIQNKIVEDYKKQFFREIGHKEKTTKVSNEIHKESENEEENIGDSKMKKVKDGAFDNVTKMLRNVGHIGYTEVVEDVISDYVYIIRDIENNDLYELNILNDKKKFLQSDKPYENAEEFVEEEFVEEEFVEDSYDYDLEVAKEIKEQLLEGSNADLPNNIKNIIKKYNGTITKFRVKPNEIEVDYTINGWTGYKLITLGSTFNSDINMLAEDIAHFIKKGPKNSVEDTKSKEQLEKELSEVHNKLETEPFYLNPEKDPNWRKLEKKRVKLQGELDKLKESKVKDAYGDLYVVYSNDEKLGEYSTKEEAMKNASNFKNDYKNVIIKYVKGE